jgi:8-oxo-dGTP pyrophosphatase MutT (NUDIX family)
MMLERRGAGDGFVGCSCGGRHWGRFGAAGLLVVRDGAVLLQHRAPFLQEGGTWAAPGGALDVGESPLAAALREAEEEAAVRPATVQTRHAWTVDHGSWAYTTVIADAVGPIEARDVDGEGLAVQWVPVDQVGTLALHSGFAAGWPQVRALIGRHEALLLAGDVARLGVADQALDASTTVGIPTPSPLLEDVPGRTRAWPIWEVSTAPVQRARDLVDGGWQVTVLSDDPAVRAEVADLEVLVAGSAAMHG